MTGLCDLITSQKCLREIILMMAKMWVIMPGEEAMAMQILDKDLVDILVEAVADPARVVARRNTIQETISAPSWMPEQEKVCPICGGSGWMERVGEGGYTVYAECSCGIRQRDILDGRLHFASIPDAFRGARLYQFDLNAYRDGRSRSMIGVSYDCIRCWLEDFQNMQRAGMGLYIFSGTKGSGKTRMAASVANELIHEHGISVKFSTSVQIISEIKRSWDRDTDMTEGRLLDGLARAEVLVVDDFGMEKYGTNNGKMDWLDSRFYQIMNERCANKKVTIFTSNYSIDDLPYDERLVSRIKERTYQIPFPEESVREHISERNMADLMERVSRFREREGRQMSMEDMMDK